MTSLIKNTAFGVLALLSFPSEPRALTLDQQTQLVIQVYGLSSDLCEVNEKLVDPRRAAIGKVLFETPVLSGNYDTSCRTCHLKDHMLADGLPMAVGVGGDGESKDRLNSDGVVVPRNAFTLFGRASEDYDVFFWDGKIHAQNGKIFSPIGEGYSLGFNSALAVAAVLPLLARDEFLGKQSIFDSTPHLDLIDTAYYAEKVDAANSVLRSTLDNVDNQLVQRLKKVLAQQGVGPNEFTLPFVGNSLASFIAQEVGDCPQTKWSRYLAGDNSALSETEKRGALIFYGKGRCAACHSGNKFTDFKFHSIGVPQGDLGTHIHGQDIGRAGVTYKTEDRFKFRTPPLLLVSHTPPYGHSGEFEHLEDIVRFHINPIPYFAESGWNSERELLSYGKLLGSRSELLQFIDISSQKELNELVAFLETL